MVSKILQRHYAAGVMALLFLGICCRTRAQRRADCVALQSKITGMEEMIVNKVAESGLVTIDLEEYYPKGEIKIFDLKDYLFMGLILKEKDFRAALQAKDWTEYNGVYAGITCSADAIIPAWAYMLVASYIQPVAKEVVFGDKKTLVNTIFIKRISSINGADFADKRIIVKGCGDVQVPETAYLEITNKLRPYVKSIMYGEACSNVPVYKRR